MEDITKSVQLDVNRIILQLIIPGLTATLPFFLIFLISYPEAYKYFEHSEAMCTILMALISMGAGLILEDLGTIIEESCFDKILKSRDQNFSKKWYDYLCMEMESSKKIIAHGFIKRTVIRLKFELSMCVAQIPLIIGLFWLNSKIHFLESCAKQFLFLGLLPLLISIYLGWEAWKGCISLAELRTEIFERKS